MPDAAASCNTPSIALIDLLVSQPANAIYLNACEASVALNLLDEPSCFAFADIFSSSALVAPEIACTSDMDASKALPTSITYCVACFAAAVIAAALTNPAIICVALLTAASMPVQLEPTSRSASRKLFLMPDVSVFLPNSSVDLSASSADFAIFSALSLTDSDALCISSVRGALLTPSPMPSRD